MPVGGEKPPGLREAFETSVCEEDAVATAEPRAAEMEKSPTDEPRPSGAAPVERMVLITAFAGVDGRLNAEADGTSFGGLVLALLGGNFGGLWPRETKGPNEAAYVPTSALIASAASRAS